jgi:hypothetical protein
MSSNNEIVVVEPRSGQVEPVVRLSQALIPLVEALNPLGSIGRAVVEIMAYRTEVKRLSLESERIKAQSKAIDRYFNSKMKDLAFRREAILIGINHAEIVIYERRETRNALIRSLDNANEAMSKLISGRNLPPSDVLAVYRDTIGQLINSLVELDSHNVRQVTSMSKELRLIVRDTKRELEAMPQIKQLPPASR